MDTEHIKQYERYEIKKWWFPSVIYNYYVRLVLIQKIWWGVRPGKLMLDLFKSCKSHHEWTKMPARQCQNKKKEVCWCYYNVRWHLLNVIINSGGCSQN